MSSSHSKPENATLATLVRPEQGQKNSQDGDPNKPTRKAYASRSNSASLLTQALGAINHAERSAPATCPDRHSLGSSVGFSKPPQERAEEQTNNGLKQANQVEHPTRGMAVIVPAGDLGGIDLLGVKSTQSSLYDRHDILPLSTSHRELLVSTRGRGTSLERTEKEKRVQFSPKGTHSNNPGDTALPPSPVSQSPTLSQPISHNEPTEGVRARYRSWRDPYPNRAAEKAWSIGEYGNSDSQGGQVEKSITEAMSGVEPSNRNRKASHNLRLFKEGLPEDSSKRREAKNRGPSKEGSSRANGSSGLQQGKPKSDQESYTMRKLPEVPNYGHIPMNGSPSKGSIVSKEGYFDTFHLAEINPKDHMKAIPPQLLADIRKHHNLTPGAAKGTSFSRSLPVTESEKPKSDNDGQDSESLGPVMIFEGSKDDDTELSHVKCADDEDESGEEQVSSALFVPHQTPHESPGGRQGLFESITTPENNDQRLLDIPNPQQWLEEHEVPSRDLDKKYLIPEAKSQPLPPPTRSKRPSPYAEKQGFTTGSEEISVLDNETPDEGGYTTAGEESSVIGDHDLTPTSSVKQGHQIPNGYNQHVHDHQKTPKQPLAAIELIPYRHQVGGHTTMWRFSKRAVCKQLNNRENEFYEKVERYHPQLLKFLPRYVKKFHLSC
jgi:inositol-hexakisphosphate kinase